MIQDNLMKEMESKKNKERREYKIFISHSHKDKEIVGAFVELLERLGLSSKEVFCSSIPGYNVPLGMDIFEYLRELLRKENILVIFMLSKNYYESTVCMNEMGAAWVLKSDYYSVLLPGFQFKEIEGAINPNLIAIDLNSNPVDRLNELKEKLEEIYGYEKVNINTWERYRNKFLEICMGKIC